MANNPNYQLAPDLGEFFNQERILQAEAESYGWNIFDNDKLLDPDGNSVAAAEQLEGVLTDAGRFIYSGDDIYKPKAAPSYSPVQARFMFPLNLNSETDPWIHMAITEPQGQAHKIKFGLALYMPQTIRVSYGQEYTPVELGFTQDMANLFTTAMQKLPGLAEQFGANANVKRYAEMLATGSRNHVGETLQNPLTGTAIAGGRALMGLSMMNMFSAGNAGSLLQIKNRMAVNPHQALAYKSPNLRGFELDFVLCPKSLQESQVVEAIIHQLKAAQAPEVIDQPTAAQAQFFKYPDNFILSVFGPSRGTNMDAKPLFRFGPSVLENMTIDYTGSGQPSFFKLSGEPTQVNLSLRFMETVVLTKKEIQNWF